MRKVAAIVLAFAVIGTTLFVMRQPDPGNAAPAIPEIVSEQGGFTLVLPPDDTPLVRFDLFDPASSEPYYEANERRIQQLINQPAGQTDLIKVTLTFKKSVPWEEFVALRDQVGLETNIITFAERGPEGEKWAIDVVQWMPDEELTAFVARDAVKVNTTVLGVILVEASITPDQETLGVLASDPRVFAVDTVRVEAAQLLAQQSDEFGSVDPAKIGVPSPYWHFDWP